MNGDSSAATGGVPPPGGPRQEPALKAKVDGIMRIAGFVRGEDGHWYKPENRDGEPTANRDAVRGL